MRAVRASGGGASDRISANRHYRNPEIDSVTVITDTVLVGQNRIRDYILRYRLGATVPRVGRVVVAVWQPGLAVGRRSGPGGGRSRSRLSLLHHLPHRRVQVRQVGRVAAMVRV